MTLKSLELPLRELNNWHQVSSEIDDLSVDWASVRLCQKFSTLAVSLWLRAVWIFWMSSVAESEPSSSSSIFMR